MLSKQMLEPVEQSALSIPTRLDTYSIANRCRVMRLVRLQVLKACDAASTACSNSAFVVSGTRESKDCVDFQIQTII